MNTPPEANKAAAITCGGCLLVVAACAIIGSLLPPRTAGPQTLAQVAAMRAEALSKPADSLLNAYGEPSTRVNATIGGRSVQIWTYAEPDGHINVAVPQDSGVVESIQPAPGQ